MTERGLIVNDPASWARVREAADEQMRADLVTLEQAPLNYGDFIAWGITGKVGPAVDKLSQVHRVGLPKGNVVYTTCEEPIPAPKLWLPLSAAITRTLSRCGHCEAKHAEQTRGMAA